MSEPGIPSPATNIAAEETARHRDGGGAIQLAELEGHLGYFVRRLQIWIFQDFIRTLASVDIRPAQYSVLVVIGANPGISQRDVAEALGIERARLVHLLDKLERRHLIERRRSATDRRSHALHLTADGARTLRRAKSLAAQHEAQLADAIGPERHRLILEALRRFG